METDCMRVCRSGRVLLNRQESSIAAAVPHTTLVNFNVDES